MALAVCLARSRSGTAPEIQATLGTAGLAWIAAVALPHAGAGLHWALMIAAMMGPTLVTQLGHIRARSFAGRKTRALALFCLSYLSVWMAVGLSAHLVLPTGPWAAATLCALAALWQATRWKTTALAQCHARPVLTAFGPQADRDVARFGLRHARACVLSCGPIMLIMVASHDLHVMAILTALILTERATHNGLPSRFCLPLLALAAALALGALTAPSPASALFFGPTGLIC